MVRHVPRTVVVVDTSASMTEAHLERALAEIRGLLRAVGVHDKGLTVVSCDSAVNATQQVFSVDNVRLIGGGGTDMREGLDSAAKLLPRPGTGRCDHRWLHPVAGQATKCSHDRGFGR